MVTTIQPSPKQGSYVVLPSGSISSRSGVLVTYSKVGLDCAGGVGLEFDSGGWWIGRSHPTQAELVVPDELQLPLMQQVELQ